MIYWAGCQRSEIGFAWYRLGTLSYWRPAAQQRVFDQEDYCPDGQDQPASKQPSLCILCCAITMWESLRDELEHDVHNSVCAARAFLGAMGQAFPALLTTMIL